MGNVGGSKINTCGSTPVFRPVYRKFLPERAEIEAFDYRCNWRNSTCSEFGGIIEGKFNTQFRVRHPLCPCCQFFLYFLLLFSKSVTIPGKAHRVVLLFSSIALAPLCIVHYIELLFRDQYLFIYLYP